MRGLVFSCCDGTVITKFISWWFITACVLCSAVLKYLFNSMSLCDAVWRHRSGSTLAQVMAIVWGFNVFKYCYGSLTDPRLRRIHIGSKRYGILISEEHFLFKLRTVPSLKWCSVFFFFKSKHWHRISFIWSLCHNPLSVHQLTQIIQSNHRISRWCCGANYLRDGLNDMTWCLFS